MELATIKTDLYAILNAVTGIGIVHARDRYSNDWNTFLALFKDTDGRINGCMFSREKCATQRRVQGEVERAHVFVIRRVMGFRDADNTADLFDEHLQDILAALTDADTLNTGDCTTEPDWGPMSGVVGGQLEISEPRMFGSVLCHYAEIRLCVCVDEAS